MSVCLVWYTVKHSISCFYLVSDWRGRFMSCARVFISNRLSDEGTIGSDEDHCVEWRKTAFRWFRRNPAQEKDLNGVAIVCDKSSITLLLNVESKSLVNTCAFLVLKALRFCLCMFFSYKWTRDGRVGPTTPTLVGPKILSFMVKALYFQSSGRTKNCQIEVLFKRSDQSCSPSAIPVDHFVSGFKEKNHYYIVIIIKHKACL